MSKPNIVLITIDCLRADKVGFLNENITFTPTMDRLAEKATIATDAISPSTHTRASVPALLTSQYAHKFFSEFLKDVTIPTLSEYLKDAGYSTGAFHSNPLLSEYFGYDRGFDIFCDGLPTLPTFMKSERLIRIFSKVERLLQRYPYKPAPWITKKAIDWLGKSSSPFFLWVHYMDPHGPYTLNRSLSYLDKFQSEKLWHKAVSSPDQVTPKERAKLLEAYHREISYVDSNIKDLINSIYKRNRNNILIITADHGEELGEHGEFSHHPKLFEEIVRVPLIMQFPNNTIKTSLIADFPIISLLYLVPTILEYLEISPNHSLDGKSLFESITGMGKLNRDSLVIETNPARSISIGIRTERWKLISTNNQTQLYDLRQDPQEKNDVISSHPEVFKELQKRLTDHIEDYNIDFSANNLSKNLYQTDKVIKSRLEDLGYLD